MIPDPIENQYKRNCSSIIDALNTSRWKDAVQICDNLMISTLKAALKKSLKKKGGNKKRRGPQSKKNKIDTLIVYNCSLSTKNDDFLALVKLLKAQALVHLNYYQTSFLLVKQVMDEQHSLKYIQEQIEFSLKIIGKSYLYYDYLLNQWKNLKNPTVSIGKNAFFAAVQTHNFSQQQQISRKLFQMTKSITYLEWWTTSMSLSDQKPLSWTIATRLVEKQLESNQASPAIFSLYIDILSRRKFKKLALINDKNLDSSVLKAFKQVLDPKLGGRYMPVDQVRLVLLNDLAWRLEDFKSCILICQQLILEHGADDWGYYSRFVDCANKLWLAQSSSIVSKSDQDSQAQVIQLCHKVESNPSLKSCQSFLEGLKLQYPKYRGPFLAILYLEYYRFRASKPKLATEKFANLIIEYTKTFGSKPVCFSDIAGFVLMAGKAFYSRPKLFSDFFSPTITLPTLQGTYTKSQLSDIIYPKVLQVKFRFSDRIQPSIELYQHFEPFVQKLQLEETESNFIDEFLVLAAGQYLTDDILEKKTLGDSLFNVAAIANHGLLTSRYSSNLKLLLFIALGLLGGTQSLLSIFSSLDIKSVLMDSMGWLVFPTFDGLADPSGCDNMYSKFEHLYNESIVNGGTFVVNCFSHRSYNQVEETIRFQDLLGSSFQRLWYLVSIEHTACIKHLFAKIHTREELFQSSQIFYSKSTLESDILTNKLNPQIGTSCVPDDPKGYGNWILFPTRPPIWTNSLLFDEHPSSDLHENDLLFCEPRLHFNQDFNVIQSLFPQIYSRTHMELMYSGTLFSKVEKTNLLSSHNKRTYQFNKFSYMFCPLFSEKYAGLILRYRALHVVLLGAALKNSDTLSGQTTQSTQTTQTTTQSTPTTSTQTSKPTPAPILHNLETLTQEISRIYKRFSSNWDEIPDIDPHFVKRTRLFRNMIQTSFALLTNTFSNSHRIPLDDDILSDSVSLFWFLQYFNQYCIIPLLFSIFSSKISSECKSWIQSLQSQLLKAKFSSPLEPFVFSNPHTASKTFQSNDQLFSTIIDSQKSVLSRFQICISNLLILIGE